MAEQDHRRSHVELVQAIVDTSRLLNDSYPEHLCREAVDRRRFNKLSEEVGEVTDAYGGMVGENPRKGVTHTLDDVLAELLDVAMCALAAYEHFTNHAGTCLVDMNRHATSRHARLAVAIAGKSTDG